MFGQHLLELAAARSELITHNLARYADAPLSAVLGQFRHEPVAPLQNRDDLWEVIEQTASSYYGDMVASEAVAALRDEPILSTSNHFGIDTMAVSVQDTLLFAVRPGRRRRTVVLGCGSVSMDSATYPMGLLLYDHVAGRLTHRLPVHANRFRRWMVCAAGPFDERMVGQARDRLPNMGLTAFGRRAAARALDEVFADRAVLDQPSYGRQATAVNARLWSRMFAPGTEPVGIVQLSLEETVTALLAKDLPDPDSLVHRLIFRPEVRDPLLAGLDGERACWRLDDLRQRLAGGKPTGDGTVFFWGVTSDGRRIPLTVAGPRLAGVDSKQRRWEWELTPDAIVEALTNGQLIPSLVTCFVELAFARAISCLGGPYQASYLPVMQRAVAAAVRRVDPGAAELITAVPTRLPLADLQFAMRITHDNLGIPAGPLEIAAAGGLTESDLHQITDSVTVREAYLAALPDLFPQLVPDSPITDGWLEHIATENPQTCPNIIRLY
jgi:hypothetical protein